MMLYPGSLYEQYVRRYSGTPDNADDYDPRGAASPTPLSIAGGAISDSMRRALGLAIDTNPATLALGGGEAAVRGARDAYDFATSPLDDTRPAPAPVAPPVGPPRLAVASGVAPAPAPPMPPLHALSSREPFPGARPSAPDPDAPGRVRVIRDAAGNIIGASNTDGGTSRLAKTLGNDAEDFQQTRGGYYQAETPESRFRTANETAAIRDAEDMAAGRPTLRDRIAQEMERVKGEQAVLKEQTEQQGRLDVATAPQRDRLDLAARIESDYQAKLHELAGLPPEEAAARKAELDAKREAMRAALKLD